MFAESDKDDVPFDFADQDFTGTRPIRPQVQAAILDVWTYVEEVIVTGYDEEGLEGVLLSSERGVLAKS